MLQWLSLGRAKSVKVAERDIPLSLTVVGDKEDIAATELLRSVHRLRRQHLTLIERNFRKDLQNWLAA